MFELVRAYEVAKYEKNKLLRFFLVNYTKHKLKKIFFNKFDIHKMYLHRSLLYEFFQTYECMSFESRDYSDSEINLKYPHIFYIDSRRRLIEVRYHGFAILYEILDTGYTISILRTPRNHSVLNIHPDDKVMNVLFFKEIILMTIYNYCVVYIYGYNSDLYIDDKQYIQSLYDMYI